MAATYEPIATTTLGSAATITFSSIPSTYTDLRLVLVTNPAGSFSTTMRFNTDSSSLYSYTWLQGNGSTASSSAATNDNRFYFDSALAGGNMSMFTVDLFSYTGSTYKTFLTTTSEDNNGSGAVIRSVGLYRSTTAISTINLLNTYAIGTTATLYGIKAA